ncbi:MAG: ATP-binding protein [Pirellulaceae bacterium]|nr:ATP-binding protein [Pirellulaceae bacterium]
MNLLKFWPKEADCLACIKPEAENPSDAVFLAVHQEMRLLRKSFSSDTSVPEKKSQRQFLNDFLKDDPSGRVIVPILGESGIGKSHLVRWLDVQLRQRDDTKARHVIRIPKSSSLKSVLGRILGGLEGPRYQQIRDQLKSAREQMDDISAKQRVRAELLSAIQRNYEAASARQAKARETGDKLGHTDTLWLKHGDPRKLPALFDDPATQKLFLVGTKERPGIISELARHVTKDTSEAEAPRRQFEAADFEIPKSLEKEVSEAGVIAASYLRNHLLKTTSSKSLDEVVDLLNSIVDDAIAPLATPQDTSLAELFYEVRRQLLADGRELVLLVEDFAVLAGVQKALLDAIIREGEVGGKREACMIRTALAVTDGYFGNLETVKTRAVHGWWIESGENDDEASIENQIGDFVATYVNAARMGAERLEEFYAKSSNAGKRAPNAVDIIGVEEDEAVLLEGFGKSANGYAMFPFNQAAIRTIAHWKLRRNDRLRFHPRSIISEVILPVLKEYRSDYERSRFPPEQFIGYPRNRIDADLNSEVGKRVSDAERRVQYLYVLEFWGDRPKWIAEAKVPAAIFKVFGLEALDGQAAKAKPVELKPISSEGGSTQPTGAIANKEGDKPANEKTEADREPKPISEFLDRINTWRSGGTLGQNDANRVRQWINTHILNSVNWEAELLRSVTPAADTYFRRIYLPNAKGNPPDIEKAFIVVATDEAFADSDIANRIFKAIRAMVRYEHYNAWDYEGSDSDYIELTNFVEPFLATAASWVRIRYKNLDGNPVPALAQALLWQARILNIESAHRNDDASQMNAVFATPPAAFMRDDDAAWNLFIDQLLAKRHLLITELLERVGAYQGKGKTPHAVDVNQLLETVQVFRKACMVNEEFPKPTASATDELKQIHEHITQLTRFGISKIDDRRKRIAEQSKQIVAELGADYDKNDLIRDLVDVCDLSEKHGLGGTVSVGQVRKLAEEFRTAKAKEVGEQVEAITNSEDLGARMSAIAKLDIGTLAFLKTFTSTCAQFLKERSGKAAGQIMNWTDAVVESSKADVDALLADLENAAISFTESKS